MKCTVCGKKEALKSRVYNGCCVDCHMEITRQNTALVLMHEKEVKEHPDRFIDNTLHPFPKLFAIYPDRHFAKHLPTHTSIFSHKHGNVIKQSGYSLKCAYKQSSKYDPAVCHVEGKR